MKTWKTEVYALCPKDRKLKVFPGPDAIGKDKADARQYLDKRGFKYAKIKSEKNKIIYLNRKD